MMNTARGRRWNAVEEIVHDAWRCLYCAHPTCLQCCPTELDVRRMVHAAGERNFYEAARIALSANPLALSCGHMCNAGVCCEGGCNLSKTRAGAIHIRDIQRFSLEQFKQLRIPLTIGAVPKIPHRVAIIGGGPAGVAAAAFCARLNFESVDVFEKSARPSGILTEQIQTARLPAEDIAFELGLLQAYPNVHVHLNAPVEAGGMRKLRAEYAVKMCTPRRRNTARSTDEHCQNVRPSTAILPTLFSVPASTVSLLLCFVLHTSKQHGSILRPSSILSLSHRKKRFLLACPFIGRLLSPFPTILPAPAFIFQCLHQAVFVSSATPHLCHFPRIFLS